MSKDMVEQIADCLLQNHMELMAEVKHLRDELERVLVRTPLSDDKLWEIWNADVGDNSPERFNEFLHAARLIEKTHGIGRPKSFIEENYIDSKGNQLSVGDYIHNKHTGDIGQIDTKKHKVTHHDGKSSSSKKLGIKDWWTKIDKNEYDAKANELTKKDASEKELKGLIKRATR